MCPCVSVCVSHTHIRQVKVVVGVEHNGEHGEGYLQHSELEGAQLQEEQGTSAGGMEDGRICFHQYHIVSSTTV